ncbi:MAG: glycosyltransferase [Methyloligellaceae bacterium]
MRVSVVIPAYNEKGNIGRLVEETFDTLSDEMLSEILVVDDGSDDGTDEEVKALVAERPKLRYLRHAGRSGQSAALRSGILAASSAVIATMDGDGQNDPRDIPRLIEHLAAPGSQGAALVGGIRESRKAVGSRRLASTFANWVRGALLRDNCPDSGCGIKVYWREAFLRLPFFTTMHRYLPALFLICGYDVDYLAVNDRPRMTGQSKYTNLGRAFVGVYDLVGVTWIKRRTKIPGIIEDVSGTERVSDISGQAHRRGQSKVPKVGEPV